jgi:hypothetical protein
MMSQAIRMEWFVAISTPAVGSELDMPELHMPELRCRSWHCPGTLCPHSQVSAEVTLLQIYVQ